MDADGALRGRNGIGHAATVDQRVHVDVLRLDVAQIAIVVDGLEAVLLVLVRLLASHAKVLHDGAAEKVLATVLITYGRRVTVAADRLPTG